MPMVSALRAVLFYSTGVSAVRHIAILAFFNYLLYHCHNLETISPSVLNIF